MLIRCSTLRFLLSLALLASGIGCASRTATQSRSLIVLGVDGMDPNFVERHWDELPNLAALRNQGSFQRLGTTTPPQSPVAWSTFITGLEPADHEIFDFVHRDPKSLQPFSSMSRTEGAARTLTLGPYILPLSSSRVVSLRQGVPFWARLSEAGIPVDVVRMPTNYPPEAHGRALAGMGTPDLIGTLGTFTFFTDDPLEVSRVVPGGRIVKVTLHLNRAQLVLEGPANALRKDGHPTSVKVTVDVDPDSGARIQAGETVAILREGEWSDWIPVEFELIPHLSSVAGTVRIFAKQLSPGLELYFSPINIDPLNPALPVSTPPHWSKTVAREAGRYYTMGIPEDTSALRQNVLTLDQFLAQTKLVFEEEHAMLRYSLRHFRGGLLFFYFSSVDQNSHMLWGKHEEDLLKVYREVDASIGEVRKSAPAAELIVISDHGFTTYDRSVHLNTWLNHRGFLGARGQPGNESDLSSIDWASTQAYALGLNGLYVNLKGREAHGTVSSGEQLRAVVANLRQQLLAWRDPLNGRQVVESLEEIRKTPHNAEFAPDLIVGYARGYRASWQTGLGGMAAEALEDNTDAWIADHCINAADVPGVLFTSRRIAGRNPRLQDVTASVLGFFGLSRPESSSARSFY
jgi:predicted AlkP superfamily phosphohydrolase/phosphomutase